MADITLKGPQLPFVLGGAGALTVHAHTTDIGKPLSPDVAVLLDIETGANASKPMALGGAGSWTLAVKASSDVKLQPIWPSSDALVRQYGLGSEAIERELRPRRHSGVFIQSWIWF